MTSEQFNELFSTRSYQEARKIVHDEIRRIGKFPVTGYENKAELVAHAVDGIQSVQIDGKIKYSGGGKEPPKGDSKAPQGGQAPQGGGEPQQELPLGKGEGKGEGQGQGDGDSQGKPDVSEPQKVPSPQDGGDEDSFLKAIKDAEEEAKRREEEAKKRREEAEAFKKKLEDLRRKMEEEKKRKQEEERKKKEREAKGRPHYKTDELVETLEVCGQAYLVGPAGTGKSTLAMDACCKLFNVTKDKPDEFSKVFAQISFSPDTTSGEMIGRNDINGVFHESEIVRVFRDGGVILFDELDNADASMLIKLNTALANGFIATPNGQVKRAANTYIICTANTFGTGPDAMYVGRTRLDAATLDRFVLCTIDVDYDVKLEKAIANPLAKETRDWLMEFVKKCRKVIETQHLRRLCSTRAVIAATKFLAKGKDTKFIEDRFLKGWSETEKAAVRAA